MHGDAPLGAEHIEALAGPGATTIAAQLEARHEARSHSPRYSLAGDLAEALDEGSQLDAEFNHALSYFAGWARDEARAGRRDGVLLETPALVELLERAQARGRHEEVVRLGIAIEGALAWGNRWAAWKRGARARCSPRRARPGTAGPRPPRCISSARAPYGSGDARAATELLEQALALREQIGDARRGRGRRARTCASSAAARRCRSA